MARTLSSLRRGTPAGWRRGTRRPGFGGAQRWRGGGWAAGGLAADSAPAVFGGARVLQGRELSYTNLLDLDAAARIALEFDEPAAVVIKHTNPCGVATAATCAQAYLR